MNKKQQMYFFCDNCKQEFKGLSNKIRITITDQNKHYSSGLAWRNSYSHELCNKCVKAKRKIIEKL